MFLMWLKPRKRKARPDEENYAIRKNFHVPIHVTKTVLLIMWWCCLPFLFLAFDETIGAFKIVTVALFIFEVCSKVTDPDYYYFKINE